MMAPHLPLPISGGRCGDNGGATSNPLESLRSAMAGGRDWTDKGRIGRRARGRRVLRFAPPAIPECSSRPHQRSGRHHGDDDNNDVVVKRSPRHVSGPFHSLCGAGIAKKLMRRSSDESTSWRSGAAPQRSSSTCPTKR